MNIWILNHYANVPEFPGGNRHFYFAKELTKRGNRVYVFASSFSHRTRKDIGIERKKRFIKKNIDGVEFIRVKTSSYYGGNNWRRVLNMISYCHNVLIVGLKIKEKPDVILASSPHLFTGLAGYFLAKIKKARFILEIRDLWPETLVNIGNYSNKHILITLLKALEKFLYQKSESIIVLMPRASDYITGLGILSEKIHWIPNGVDIDLFKNLNYELPDKLANTLIELTSQKKIIAVYTGAHGVANALDTIIKAAGIVQQKVKDKIHFVMVGDGSEKNNLIKLASKLKLNNVVFYDSVPKTMIPRLLQSIDITLISMKATSLYKYGMSLNKLNDYMASAKPIVWGTNSINNPVADAHCGITVPPENPKALADAILEMCDLSLEERQKLGKNGYDYVMKYHSTPVLVDKLIKIMVID